MELLAFYLEGVKYELLELLIWAILWGFATKIVINKKGYEKNWFWWGFFFGIIAFIVALVKEPAPKEIPVSNSQDGTLSRLVAQKRDEDKRKEGYWKCICGNLNPPYTGTCVCGRTVQEVRQYMLKKEKEKQEKEKGNREADNIEKLKKYKELLDSGIISQDEFDKKKSELLNL